MTFHLDSIIQDIVDEEVSWHANNKSFQTIQPKRLMRQLSNSSEEDEMSDNLCPYNLPEYLALCAFPLFTVGLILTGISVYVYTRPYQLKTTVGFLLACLSIFEWFFLLTSFQSFSISEIPFFTCPSYVNHYPKMKSYSKVYIYPLTHVTKYMCVCISILISIQQWIAVFLPMEAKNLCNMKRTKLFLLFSFIFSIFLSIPRFLEQIIHKYSGRPTANDKWRNYLLIEAIDYFDNKIFNAFTIFFLLFMINISIICLLKWSQHERMRMTSQSIKDRRTSLMLFAVLFSYVSTHFPSMLIEYNIEFLPEKIYNVRKEISNFFMCCHPLFSFADYLIFSEKYRNTVESIFIRHQNVSSSNKPQAV